MLSLPFYISGTIKKWLNENIQWNNQTFRLSNSLIAMSITKSPNNSESKRYGVRMTCILIFPTSSSENVNISSMLLKQNIFPFHHFSG